MFYLNVCLKKLFEIFRDGMDAGLLVDTEGAASGAMASYDGLYLVGRGLVYTAHTEAEGAYSPPFDSFLYSIVQSPCQRVVFSLCIALTIRSRPVRMIERGIARFRRI